MGHLRVIRVSDASNPPLDDSIFSARGIRLSVWRSWYEEISNQLGLSRRRDQDATDLLSELLGAKSGSMARLRKLITKRNVFILGAGPSADQDVASASDAGLFDSMPILAADGATSALLDHSKARPHVIVTDLDGLMPDIMDCQRLGSTVVVHAHSDNVQKLLEWVPSMREVVGTTQVSPRPRVHNFGGFTDGDRAAFLCAYLRASRIVVAGMDLGKEIGRYSPMQGKSAERKMIKLSLCKKLLEWLGKRCTIRLLNMTARGVPIEGFTQVDAQTVRTMMDS